MEMHEIFTNAMDKLREAGYIGKTSGMTKEGYEYDILFYFQDKLMIEFNIRKGRKKVEDKNEQLEVVKKLILGGTLSRLCNK